MLVSLVQSALQRCTSLLFRMLGAIIGRDVGGAGPAVDGTAAAGASGAAQVAGNSATDDGDWNLTLVDPLAELAEPLKSRESRHSLFLRFVNGCNEPIRLYWLDYSGAQIRYKTIDVGRSHRQQSFLSHPWTASTITHPPVRLACNGQAAIYPLADADAPVEQLGQDTEAMVVRIERPPVLEWSPRAHAAFPDVFRSAVQTFILCHATLAAVSEDASSPRRVCTLGSLPVVLRDVIIGKAAPRIPSWAPIRLPRPETPVAQDDDQ